MQSTRISTSPTAPTCRAHGLRARVPSARPRGRGRLLHTHRLSWHKRGPGRFRQVRHRAHGHTERRCGACLYDVARIEKPALDAVEGLGVGYFEKEVRIVTDEGERLALTYHANPDRTDPALHPRDWYKDHVVRGAREHGLPADYIREIESIEIVVDDHRGTTPRE